MSRSSLLLAPLLLTACLPSAPTGLGAQPTMGPTCSADPAKDSPMMDYSTAAGDSTIGAVPQLWSKQYGDPETCKGGVKKLGGDIAEPVESNDSLGSEAIGMANQGKLCAAKVYRARASGKIKVYRVWSTDIRRHEFGSWWSLDMPTGSKADYMRKYGACPSWGKFDRLTECTIRAGVEFAIGPGQSHTCGKTTYDMSEANQVFIPVRPPNPATMWLENCRLVTENPLTE